MQFDLLNGHRSHPGNSITDAKHGTVPLWVVPLRFVLYFVVASLPLLAGCQKGGARANAAKPKPRETAERAIAMLDKNSDSLINADELKAHPGLNSAVKRIDADGDGQLSSEEIRTYLKSNYQDVDLSLRSLICVVTLGENTPIPGATVTLVPEPFLGEEIKPATAVTDAFGRGNLVSEGAKYPGVQMGIYQIKVSRIDPSNGKETIPAKYNEKTELGVEVSNTTSNELEEGLKLQLKR
jgi:hypothetical protein